MYAASTARRASSVDRLDKLIERLRGQVFRSDEAGGILAKEGMVFTVIAGYLCHLGPGMILRDRLALVNVTSLGAESAPYARVEVICCQSAD